MSDTPRTKSEAIRYAVGLGHIACNRVEELETELAEARAEIASAKANYDLLKELVTGCYPEKLKAALKENFDLKVKLAVLAAERDDK